MDCLLALERGLPALTTTGGAGSWRDEWNELFRGKYVVICYDNDDAGRAGAANVARQLHGTAAGVKIVTLPLVEVGADFTDYIQGHGHTVQDFLVLVQRAPLFTPEAQPSRSTPDQRHSTSTVAIAEGELFDDIGNARRFVRLFSDRVRYAPGIGWLIWDGRRWQRDLANVVWELAKQTARSIRAEAAVAGVSDEDSKNILAWARASATHKKLHAILELAKSDPSIVIMPQQLDADPRRLNVLNGTLDLRTGTLRPHDRADLLTKIISIPFDPEASAPQWERFVSEIMNDRPALVGFLRRFIGYSLTGETREQVLAILYGLGENGKGVFLRLWRRIMGEYAQIMRFETLTAPRNRPGASDDLAELHGVRLATASEVRDGQLFNEQVVKQLTGEEGIRARHMYASALEFDPVLKIVIAANHLPHIRGTDHAIWRRVRTIPFDVTFTDDPSVLPPGRACRPRNNHLFEQLLSELPGILQWAVQGCLEWQREGLGSAPDVDATTRDYRETQDLLGAFLRECCVLGERLVVGASELYQAYKRWAENGAEYVMSQRTFGSKLTERGIGSDDRGPKRTIRRLGVALRNADLMDLTGQFQPTSSSVSPAREEVVENRSARSTRSANDGPGDPVEVPF